MIRRSGSDPSGPCAGQLVVAGQAFQQQQVGRVAEMRDEGVHQLARQVIDVERVADPGEGVVEHLPAHERGVDEAFSPGAGMRSRASAARLVPPARIGWTVTTASVGGPSRVSIVSMALPSRSERIASSSPATAAALSACRAACEFACAAFGWALFPCGTGRRELDELRTEQILRLAGQDLGRVPVVLDDAPVVVDPEDQGPHGRGHSRVSTLGSRTLGSTVSGRGLRGFGDPGLLEVRAGTGLVASLGSVARSPRQRGMTRRGTALGSSSPESAVLRRNARCHVRSPDGIAGCAPVNYGPRTARSDRSSDDSPFSRKVSFYALLT